MARHHRPRERYEDVVLRTKPVLYVPMQGQKIRELVRGVDCTVSNSPTLGASGPFPGEQAIRFSASTADNDAVSVATNASYHPGDTFTVAGWFNRLGTGDASPSLIHLGSNDLTVFINSSVNGNYLALRKAGVGDIHRLGVFGSPHTAGWQFCAWTKATTTTVGYLNGVLTTSLGGSNQTIVASTVDPTFGITAGGTTIDLDGSLAHWAVWNRVLSAGEIAELYLDARRRM